MKNFVMILLVVSCLGLIGVNYQTSNKCERAEAQVNYDRAENSVKEEFKSLASTWGNMQEVDTLLSEQQWQVIHEGNMDADQMIALAETVRTAYKSNGWSDEDYSNVVNDLDFNQVVKDYEECKKKIED